MKILDIKGFIQAVFLSECLDEVWIGIFARQQNSGVPRNHVEQRKGD
jgi:hypothetical protein